VAEGIVPESSAAVAGPMFATWRLGLLGAYWLGVTAMWIGLASLLAGRLQYQHLVAPGTEGASLLQMTAGGTLVAILVQPAVGSISDHTASRWGRRLPYIIVGSLLDLLFLAGIAASQTVVAIAAFFLLLQMSSNVAQGPYQGYVPDLVRADQVGLASGLVGLMIILGNVAGYGVGALGIATGQYTAATLALGVIELSTVGLLAAGVREPPAQPRPRDGRSWLRIAGSAWGRDILRERSFLWLVGSRLFVLTGSEVLISLAPFYLARTFGLAASDAGGVLLLLVGTVALGTAVSVVPAARLSDRVGRRRVIWIACFLGATGLLVCSLAPAIPVAFAGAACFGISGGTFLAVDWALLSELVPRDATARFMGISNIATCSAALLAIAIGGIVMDLTGGPERTAIGPRAALVFGAACYAVGAVLLKGVREPPTVAHRHR
jgi:MFS family permease